jgi:hypothetical protein
LHLPVLFPVILTLVNLAIRDGMPLLYKTSAVTPLLKKKCLDPNDLSSYRPVANLSYISKLIERAVVGQIVSHLESNQLLDITQSAYRCHHSCETAILAVLNTAYLAIDKRQVTLLVLLDLSAAFDSVDHLILSQRLRKCGVVDGAHDWIMSYLSNRSQLVMIPGGNSSPLPLPCGVPQGSVLGPILFLIYLSGIGGVITPFDIHFALYADDIQLYVSTSVSDLPLTIARMEKCILALKDWLAASLLTLNGLKTEAIILGSPTILKKITFTHISVAGIDIPFRPTVRDLGVTLDSSLTFHTYITHVCRKSFIRLRLVSRLRKSISTAHYAMLTSSLVLSNLEYCAALFLQLPTTILSKLQLVINAVFRSVYRLKKSDHISDLQRSKGCRSIQQRVHLRVASILFKALHQNAPGYIAQMLIPHSSGRGLRSDSKNLLFCPRVSSAIGSRAFSVAAPVLWNSLPQDVRDASSLAQLQNRMVLQFNRL